MIINQIVRIFIVSLRVKAIVDLKNQLKLLSERYSVYTFYYQSSSMKLFYANYYSISRVPGNNNESKGRVLKRVFKSQKMKWFVNFLVLGNNTFGISFWEKTRDLHHNCNRNWIKSGKNFQGQRNQNVTKLIQNQ